MIFHIELSFQPLYLIVFELILMSSSPQILHTARVVCGRSDDGAKAFIAHFAVASHHCGIVYIHHRRIHTANMLIFLSPSSEVALVRFYLYSQSSFPSISTTRSFAPSSSGATYYMSQKKPVPHWRRKNSRMKCRSLAQQGPRARTQRLPVWLQVLDIASSWYFLYARCEMRLRLHGVHRFCTKACEANCATSLLPVM